jgi:hypothetical protein
MKFLAASLLALALGSSLATTAHATNMFSFPDVGSVPEVETVVETGVQIPAEITESASLSQYVSELLAAQAAELLWIDTQTQYFQLVRGSFAASRALAEARDMQTAGAGSIMLITDYYLLKAWLAGAKPTAMIMKDVILAERGNAGRIASIGQKSYASLIAVAKALKVPKNFVTTATLGTLTYLHVESYFVINMSKAKFDQNMAMLDAKIAELKARKAAVADKHIPYSVR